MRPCNLKSDEHCKIFIGFVNYFFQLSISSLTIFKFLWKFFFCQFKNAFFILYRRLRGRRRYPDSRMKNDVYRLADEEDVSRLADEEDVSRGEYEERRILELLLPVHGQYTAKYVVLYPRAEIRRASFARRDTSYFIFAARYVVLHLCVEIRRSSSACRDTFFFLCVVDIYNMWSKHRKKFVYLYTYISPP